MWPQSPGYVLCHQHAHCAWCHQLHRLFSGTARFQQQDSASQMIPLPFVSVCGPLEDPGITSEALVVPSAPRPCVTH